MAASSNRMALAAAGIVLISVAIGLIVWRPWTGMGADVTRRVRHFDAGSEGALAPGARPTLSPIQGKGGHSLVGYVRDAAGLPIARAAVTATMELGPGVNGITPAVATAVVAVSDEAGAFKLEGLEAGRHRIRIEGEGVLAAELRFVEAPGQGLVVLASREVQVRGRVAGVTGDPSQVKVYLRSETQTRHEEQSLPVDGRFSFEGLAEGRFQLWAQGPGQAAPIQWVERLGAGPFADVAVPMQLAYSARGRVVEAGGSDMGLVAHVVIRSATGSEPARRAVSAEDGTFSVDSLLDGRWIAQASAPGYASSESHSFSANAGVALLLNVNSGGQVVGVVRSGSGGALEGASVQLIGTGPQGETRRYGGTNPSSGSTALLASGQTFVERGELGVLLGPIPLVPPPGAFVSRVATVVSSDESKTLDNAVIGRPSAFVTDELGRYRISGVLSGRYQVHVSHPEYADFVSKDILVREKGAQLVRDVVLRSGTRLSGQVLTDKGVPVIGASIFAKFSDARDQALAVTDADGTFAFAPLSGAIDLVVEAVGYGRSWQRLRLSPGGMVAATQHVEVRLVKADAVMTGRVVDSAGFAVRDATIALAESARALPVRPARSDVDGLFRLEGLLPGVHSVVVTHPEYPPRTVKATATADVEIVVPLGAALTIHVRDQSAASALAMVEVRLVRNGSAVERRGVSDASGRVVLTALSPGAWTIDASLKGYAAASMQVNLAAKAERTAAPQRIELELVRGSVLAGVLRDEVGDRVEGAVVSAGPSRATTDSDGRFRLEDVASGSVELIIEKAGLLSRETIEVASGEERVTMDVRFAPELDDEDSVEDAERPDDSATGEPEEGHVEIDKAGRDGGDTSDADHLR